MGDELVMCEELSEMHERRFLAVHAVRSLVPLPLAMAGEEAGDTRLAAEPTSPSRNQVCRV